MSCRGSAIPESAARLASGRSSTGCRQRNDLVFFAATSATAGTGTCARRKSADSCTCSRSGVRRRFLRSYANTRTRENGSTPEKGYNYAPKIHDERGKTWQNLGPGSIAKNSSGKVGDKFIERAIADKADAFFRILQDEAKKAEASL